MTRPGRRVLIYSHDTFGLGHLRRCRALAASLTQAFPDLTALILSGSPIIGAFDFPPRVDFVRLPGVIKLTDGGYVAQKLDMRLDDLIRFRADLIDGAARAFAPDLVIVDKEPLGLRGEFESALKALKERGARLVLGLRDVLDDAASLAAEWARKRVGPALSDLYDEIWVYGCAEIYDPLRGLDLPAPVRAKTLYTGYLRREVPAYASGPRGYDPPSPPYALVTAGGGGDGEGLMDWVLSAYESGEAGLPRALMVLGPFMEPGVASGLLARAARQPLVTAVTFDAELERPMSEAAAVIAMGGYNTFCEILSFDRPAVLVPRERPRREQWIRAKRSQDLGLVAMLEDPAERGRRRDPAVMADALRRAPRLPPPSAALKPGMLDGLDAVARAAARLLAR